MRLWWRLGRAGLPRPSGSVEHQAAAWYDLTQGRAVSGDIQKAFDQWRERDPAHARAYARIHNAALRARTVLNDPAMLALEASAMAAIARTAGTRHHRSQRLRRTAVAATLIAFVSGAAFLGNGSWNELRYLGERTGYALIGQSLHRTLVGERLVIGLSDGSTMTLNTQSRAVVHYRSGERGVKLLEGQALFDVARESARPFVVTAGNRRVTALGTVFDVHMSGQQVAVTLVEGRVAVENTAPDTVASRLRTELEPGEQFIAAREVAAAPSPLAVVRSVDIARAIGWRDGQILFDDDPLPDVLTEINRYSKRQVVLADPALAGLRVSGAFNSANPAAFIEMLTAYLPLRVVEVDRERIVLGQRAVPVVEG